jgi:hypothetical protein
MTLSLIYYKLEMFLSFVKTRIRACTKDRPTKSKLSKPLMTGSLLKVLISQVNMCQTLL